MRATRFDRIARSLGAPCSRRSLLRAVPALALLASRGPWARRAQAQDATPEPATFRPEFPPIYAAADPIPLGDGDLYLDGKIISFDAGAIARAEASPEAPIMVAGDALYIDPANLVGLQATDIATPAASIDRPARSRLEGICGLNDSQDVELYDGCLGVTPGFVARHQAAVGNIRWDTDLHRHYDDPGTVNARRWCSGALISDDLFLTAAHCFDQRPGVVSVPRVNGTGVPIPRTEIATRMHVDFAYQLDEHGNDRQPVSYDIIELVEDRLGDLDFAILRLAGAPGRIYGSLAIAPADVTVGETICIIGHPAGAPKRIEAGPASEIINHRIYYDDIDTEGVSSGACILASPGGPIVGVHTNGGCEIPAIGNNHGQIISAILQASPTLRGLLAEQLVAQPVNDQEADC